MSSTNSPVNTVANLGPGLGEVSFKHVSRSLHPWLELPEDLVLQQDRLAALESGSQPLVETVVVLFGLSVLSL